MDTKQKIAELLMKADRCTSRKEAIELIHLATELMEKRQHSRVYSKREGVLNTV